MNSTTLSYAVVTPARNEAANLRRLAQCVTAQTVRPSAWIVVDDGSSDDTAAIAYELARTEPWISVISSPAAREGGDQLERGRRSGRDVTAFMAGLAALGNPPDIVVKVDADISFGPGYFEVLLLEFESDPKLGIASGGANEFEGGEWRRRNATGSRVRGASRAYRWACLQDVLPLERRLGWDVVDEVSARLRGWRTRTVGHLRFRHHRAVGARDGSRAAWAAQGEVAYYCGYRPSYLLLRTVRRARGESAALALLSGFAAAALRGAPRHHDDALRDLVREEQRLRHLPRRVRETLGLA
jgi:poly-beta-1,6-N-acetyl-D-glucosamine synthase